ncbi:MAG: hypothetical protein KDB22_22730 [Planctomycetales bacterium]|nr:hypothetical protein [Planctomycetales bacterium]
MHSPTQPILCCIGNSVGGVPIQFMMERALNDRGMDWRVITVEIVDEELETALQGMHSMKFSAVSFFAELQDKAAQVIDPDDRISRFVGSVSGAMYQSAGWLAWHSFGPATLQLLGHEGELENSWIWLSGDSVRTRSLYASLHQAAESCRLVWSHAPDISCLNETESNEHSDAPESQAAMTGLDVHQLGDEQSASDFLLEAFERDQPSPAKLLVIGDNLQKLHPHLHSLSRHYELTLLAGGQTDPKAPLDIPGRVLSEADLFVASIAYDFWRWTGITADLSSLREAYEEYCDF